MELGNSKGGNGRIRDNINRCIRICRKDFVLLTVARNKI